MDKDKLVAEQNKQYRWLVLETRKAAQKAKMLSPAEYRDMSRLLLEVMREQRALLRDISEDAGDGRGISKEVRERVAGAFDLDC